MNLRLNKSDLKLQPTQLIRRAGYGEHADFRSGQTSYAKRMGTGIFPKFHVYLADKLGQVEVSLHLDQKQPSYGSGHMHSGDYEGPVVENELERIKQVFLSAEAEENDASSGKDKKGFLGKLFG